MKSCSREIVIGARSELPIWTGAGVDMSSGKGVVEFWSTSTGYIGGVRRLAAGWTSATVSMKYKTKKHNKYTITY